MFRSCSVYQRVRHSSVFQVSVQRAVRNNEVYPMKTSARVIVNTMNAVIPHQRHQHMLPSVLRRGRSLLKVSGTVRYQAPTILFNYLTLHVSVGVFLITVGLRRNENVRLKLEKRRTLIRLLIFSQTKGDKRAVAGSLTRPDTCVRSQRSRARDADEVWQTYADTSAKYRPQKQHRQDKGESIRFRPARSPQSTLLFQVKYLCFNVWKLPFWLYIEYNRIK